MFLRRSLQIRKLGLANVYGIPRGCFHYHSGRGIHQSIRVSIRLVSFERLKFRSLWTTSHIYNDFTVDSRRKSVEYYPGFLLYSQVNPSSLSHVAKPTTPPEPKVSVEPNDPNKQQQKPDKDEKKLTLWQRAKKEILHYYHGFRLLGLEVKIASGICFRLLCGHSLTRRERKQLVRTVADIVRLVPFAVFIIVPFMEFLLPFYLKFFPFMLPSTFEDKKAQVDKIQQRLKAKLELTRFLQETLHQTTGVSTRTDGTPTFSEFQDFLKKVQESGVPPTNEELTRFSKLFEDQVTLDSLHAKQLRMLCQLLSLPTMGPRTLLKLQILLRIRQLKAEDKLLAKEGVMQIPTWELQSLCQERGMRSVGLTEERLRTQLSQWLSLHLEQNVPLTLLLFSRALYVSKAATDEISLKDAIAQLPSSASEEVTTRVLEASSDVDPLTKIEVLRKEQANIKADRAQRKQELAEQKSAADAEAKTANIESTKEALKDAAPTLKGLPGEDLTAQPLQPPVAPPPDETLPTHPAVSPASCPVCAEIQETKPVVYTKEEETEISAADLAQIGSAIATSSTALHEEAIEGLKEEVAETAKLREEHEAALISSERVVDKRTSKAAARLSAKVDAMIGEMDNMIEKLSAEREQLLENIEIHEVRAKHSSEPTEKTKMLDAIQADHQRVIDINDLLLALRRIQKVPDDTRWQKILDVLDEDHDGKIELQHVLSVIELLGSENVKLSSKEVTRVLEMIDNEEMLEHADANKSTATASKSEFTASQNSQTSTTGSNPQGNSSNHSNKETSSKNGFSN